MRNADEMEGRRKEEGRGRGVEEEGRLVKWWWVWGSFREGSEEDFCGYLISASPLTPQFVVLVSLGIGGPSDFWTHVVRGFTGRMNLGLIGMGCFFVSFGCIWTDIIYSDGHLGLDPLVFFFSHEYWRKMFSYQLFSQLLSLMPFHNPVLASCIILYSLIFQLSLN